MLVLSRNVGESIQIEDLETGEVIWITVTEKKLGLGGGTPGMRLGFTASRRFRILRSEHVGENPPPPPSV